MSQPEMISYKITEYLESRTQGIDKEIYRLCSSKEDAETPQAPTGFHKAMENIVKADEQTLDRFGMQMYILDQAVRVRRGELRPHILDAEWSQEREDQKIYRNAVLKGFLSDMHAYWDFLRGNNEELSFLYALVFPEKIKEKGQAKTFIEGMRALFHDDTLGDIMDIIIKIQKERCHLTYKGALMPYDGIICQAMGYFLQRTFIARNNVAYEAICRIIRYFAHHASRNKT